MDLLQAATEKWEWWEQIRMMISPCDWQGIDWYSWWVQFPAAIGWELTICVQCKEVYWEGPSLSWSCWEVRESSYQALQSCVCHECGLHWHSASQGGVLHAWMNIFLSKHHFQMWTARLQGVSERALPILLRKAMAVTLSNLRRIALLCVLVAKVLRARNSASNSR